MKKLYALILCAACATACVDSEYDLSKISTDDIAIGDESSQFEVPLLKVYISMDELTDVDGEAIDTVFDEADIWLPNQLPDQDGNGYFVSVQRLVEDDQYVIGVLSALLGQMASDSEKLDQVASLLQEKYYTEFSSLLPGVSAEEFKDEFIRQYTDNERLRQLLNEKIEELARGYLTGLEVSLPALTYSVDRIDLSDDVIDMLVKTSTEKRSPNPRIRSTWPEPSTTVCRSPSPPRRSSPRPKSPSRPKSRPTATETPCPKPGSSPKTCKPSSGASRSRSP